MEYEEIKRIANKYFKSSFQYQSGYKKYGLPRWGALIKMKEYISTDDFFNRKKLSDYEEIKRIANKYFKNYTEYNNGYKKYGLPCWDVLIKMKEYKNTNDFFNNDWKNIVKELTGMGVGRFNSRYKVW